MKDKIKALLKTVDEGLSFEQIREKLGEQVTVPVLRQLLNELEAEKVIAAFAEEPAGRGRPKNVYVLLEGRTIFHSKGKSEEVSEQRKLLLELISETTDRYSIMPINQLKELYKLAAKQLLTEEPIPLVMKFGLWLREQHLREITLYHQATAAHARNDAEKHKENIQRIENLSLYMINRVFGIPTTTKQTERWQPGPFVIKFDFQSQQDKSTINEQEFEKYLKLSILGRTVLQHVPKETLPLPAFIGGSDASLQAVDLSQVLPWHLESREMHLVTAVGTRYNIFKSAPSEVDWYPEPKVLAEYERKKAISEGYLIPPVFGYDDSMQPRIREAAMNLRQYHKDHELMFEKEPLTKTHFRDGRIFPMEHRFSDSIQPGLHGDLVRMALNQFKNIVNQIGVSNGSILYCGFVKRPGLEWLAPLVKWYMGFGSVLMGKNTIDADMTLDDFLKYPNADSYVASFLFNALRSDTSNDGVILTFRVMRRFHNMQEQGISNQRPSTDVGFWKEILKDKYPENAPFADESGLETYAVLCARAAVMSFYSSLDSSYDPQYEMSTPIPRIEMLVPFPSLQDYPYCGQIETIEENFVFRVMSVLFHPGVLDKYNDELFMGERNPKIFLVPKTVRDAHLAAKSIAKVYRDDFLELLVREARIFWAEKQLTSRKIR